MIAARVDPEACERTIESLKRGMAQAARGELTRRDDFIAEADDQ